MFCRSYWKICFVYQNIAIYKLLAYPLVNGSTLNIDILSFIAAVGQSLNEDSWALVQGWARDQAILLKGQCLGAQVFPT